MIKSFLRIICWVNGKDSNCSKSTFDIWFFRPLYNISEIIFTNISFPIDCFAPNLFTHKLINCHSFLSGLKYATSNSCKTSVTWGRNMVLNMSIFSSITHSITGTNTWVRWRSNSNTSGLSFFVSQNFSNHTAKMSLVIPPLSESEKNISGRPLLPAQLLW